MTGRLFGGPAIVDSDAWFTPRWIFDGLELEFDLDVAAPLERIPWIPARHQFTVVDDGLAQPWRGVVWCNPPYSDVGPWCRKWAAHDRGALLIRSDLSSSGAFAAFSAASSIYVAPKRIRYVDATGTELESSGRKSGRITFSTVLLGRGDVVDEAIARLARRYGGAARRLRT